MNLHRVIGALGDFEEDEVRTLIEAGVRELDLRVSERAEKEGTSVCFRTHGGKAACGARFYRRDPEDAPDWALVWYADLVTCPKCKWTTSYWAAWERETSEAEK